MDHIMYKGNLKDYSLPRILLHLNIRRATGTLSITTPLFTKNIYVKDGNAIFASSSDKEDRLGNLLVKAGKISIEELNRSVRMLEATHNRHGAILVELGYLSPRDLLWAVKLQVKKIIFSLFRINEAAYEFKDNFLPTDEVITLKISTKKLIYEGVRKSDNFTMLKSEIPSTDIIFSRWKDNVNILNELPLNNQDKTVFSLVNGKRTVKRVMEESQINSYDVLKILYILWLTGIIVINKTPEDNKETSAGDETQSKEIAEQKRKVDEFYMKLDSMDKSELLGINEYSDSNEVKKKYYALAKEFHPDKIFNSKDYELKTRLTAIFDAATKAYNSLKDNARRKEYFDSKGSIPRQNSDKTSTLIKEQYNTAVEDFKKGNYAGSAEKFQWLTQKDPKNPRYWSYLSIALSKMPRRLKEAEQAIMKAIELEPFNSEHFSGLGFIYLKAGLKNRAQSQFEKALKLDPQNEKAREAFSHIDKL